MAKENYPVPQDTRYVPLQQQPYLCCPTAIQIVMLRHNIPLISAELLGWHLGLRIPPEDQEYFYNPRIEKVLPPEKCGTQIKPDGSPANQAFKNLDIPLQLNIQTIDQFADINEFKTSLLSLEKNDVDILFCLYWNDILNEERSVEPVNPEASHIVVFDKIFDNEIRIIDPARGKKWRNFPIEKLYQSMQTLGAEKAAGLWILTKKLNHYRPEAGRFGTG